MNFYEHTIIARQDLSQNDLKAVEEKYASVINDNAGKVLKVEKWGILNFARKIKKYNKGFYIHYKIEGTNDTINNIKKNTKVDGSILRFLTIKYKKLDLKKSTLIKMKRNKKNK